MQMAGKLYLIPSTIGDAGIEKVIPGYISELINTLRIYIVENERTARRTLIKMGIKTAIDKLEFLILDKHTDQADIPSYLARIREEDAGLLSEAGAPAIADPGSDIIRQAHDSHIEVIPLVGPSSILLAMMASGMNGQNFAFVGYLPVKSHDRIRRIRILEQRSKTENQSQIFIETPYRNNQMLQDLLKTCSPDTRLCIACDLTSENGWVKTMSISAWKKQSPELHKLPSIYILHG